MLWCCCGCGWWINVLVGTDTGGFEGLGGQLLVLVGDHVHAQREVIDVGLLTSQIEDTDLGVGNTTVEPGLRVGLYSTHPVSNHPPHSMYQNNKSIQAPVKSRRHIFHLFIPSPVKTGVGVVALPTSELPDPKSTEHENSQKEIRSSIKRSHAPCSCSSGSISRDDGPL